MPTDAAANLVLEESFFRQLVETAPDAVVVVAEGRMVFVNTQTEKLFGYRRDELIGQPIELLIPERYREAHRGHRAAHVHAPRFRPMGEASNLTGRRKDGTEFPADIMLALLQSDQGQVVQAVIRDLTQRREAEKTLGDALRHKHADLALRASETRYRTLFDVSRDGIVFADLETGAIKHVNPAACRLLGYSEEELVTLGVADIHPKEVLPRVLAEFGDLGGPLAKDVPCLRKDGAIIYVDVNAATMTIEGRTTRVGFFRDVTERKRSEDALRESETFLRETQRVAKMGSYVMNVSTGGWRSSDVLDEIFGIDGDYERSVEGWAALVHPDDRAMMADHLENEVLGLGKAFDKEYRIVRHDNRVERWVHGLGTVQRDPLGRPLSMHGTIQDVTARKRAKEERSKLEDQLRQAQKMDAIGNLAGGVAHDFNNLLSVILSYSTLLAGDLKASDPIRADVLEIESAAKRGADLTRQLLAFGRRQVVQPRSLDLNDVVQGLQKMLGRLVGESIELTVLHTPGLGTVVADEGQIEQIVVNLVVNARDAMPHGGKLTIEVANVDLGKEYAEQHAGVSPGPHVALLVSDTGTGMDAATKAQIFEPFFTTKEKGKGTGLGLATVFGMVKQSGGFIWVYSEPGAGTTMKVYFPRAEGAPRRSTPSSLPPEATLRGSETILLVEDEEPVRVLVRAILRRCGYHVLDASNGGDGLLLCEQHGGSIHLMVTDVVMPRMSGRQLAERLRTVRPEMKVLYMSGYTDNSIVHHGVLESGVAFLQKPITPDALARKVREVLDSASPR